MTAKVQDNPPERITNAYGDEFTPQGERYIEKFQEILYEHSDPPLELLDSLQNESQQTLEKLNGILSIAAQNAEPEHRHKFEMAIEAITRALKAKGSVDNII